MPQLACAGRLRLASEQAHLVGSMCHKLDAHSGIRLVQAVSQQRQRLHITCRASLKDYPVSEGSCCRGHRGVLP
jgi:hypothetical protein